MAKVARMAERMPAVPVWAYWPISAVVALASIAAFLSKPHTGCMLMPFAFAETRAEIKSVKTQSTSMDDRIVCTMPAFLTPMIFSHPNRIRMDMARSISPI